MTAIGRLNTVKMSFFSKFNFKLNAVPTKVSARFIDINLFQNIHGKRRIKQEDPLSLIIRLIL